MFNSEVTGHLADLRCIVTPIVLASLQFPQCFIELEHLFRPYSLVLHFLFQFFCEELPRALLEEDLQAEHPEALTQ